MNGKVITSTYPSPASVAADAAAQLLGAGQPASGRGHRQHRRDPVVADQPDDLLDQVVGVGEVGAPRRRGDLDAVAVDGDAGADRQQRAGDRVVVDRQSGDPAGQVEADPDRRGLGGGADQRDAGVGGAAAVAW